jgi:rod shape determining protein RodA
MNTFKEYFDVTTFLSALALVAIGLTSIYSATYDVNNAANFWRQLTFAGVGVVAMFACLIVPLKTFQRFAFPFYVFMLLFLVAVLVVGSTIKGARAWFAVAGLGGQPSEFAKVATVMATAAWFSRPEVSIARLKDFLIGIAIFFVPMGLILAQPDLGTTIVFFGAMLPVLYWIGASNFILVAVLMPILVALGALFGTAEFLVAAAISALVLYLLRQNNFAVAIAFGVTLAIGLSVQIVYDSLAPYQQKRIATFLNPDADPLGAGYNVLQSKIAIGSGGWFGKGFLQGSQTQLNYIPEQWTDFIFCVPGEEFGFVGGMLVLVLFALLLFNALRVAAASRNRFGSIVAIGIASVLAVHVIINIGMAMAILPVVGIPLPFLSYGGSALVANLMMMGLLMNVYAHRKEY